MLPPCTTKPSSEPLTLEIAIFRAKYERKALTDYMNLDGYRSFNLNVGYLNPNFSKPYQ